MTGHQDLATPPGYGDDPVVIGPPPRRRHGGPSWLAPVSAAAAVGAIAAGIAVAAAIGPRHQHHVALPGHLGTRISNSTAPVTFAHPTTATSPIGQHHSLPSAPAQPSSSYGPTPTPT